MTTKPDTTLATLATAMGMGAAHGKQELDAALVQIVDTLDIARNRCEAVQQWAAGQTAAGLATAWGVDVPSAQAYLDACATFGNVITNAMTADPKLGPLAASLRNIGR